MSVDFFSLDYAFSLHFSLLAPFTSPGWKTKVSEEFELDGSFWQKADFFGGQRCVMCINGHSLIEPGFGSSYGSSRICFILHKNLHLSQYLHSQTDFVSLKSVGRIPWTNFRRIAKIIRHPSVYIDLAPRKSNFDICPPHAITTLLYA